VVGSILNDFGAVMLFTDSYNFGNIASKDQYFSAGKFLIFALKMQV
jgi:hypothetical protein